MTSPPGGSAESNVPWWRRREIRGKGHFDLSWLDPELLTPPKRDTEDDDARA